MNTATLGWCAAAVLAVAGQARAVDKSWNAGEWLLEHRFELVLCGCACAGGSRVSRKHDPG